MKTIKNYLGVLMLVLLTVGAVSNIQAQGRGRGKDNPGRGHQKDNPGKGHDRHNQNDQGNNDDRDHHYSRDNDRGHYSRDSHREYASRDRYVHKQYVTYNHYRYRRPMWAPTYGYRYNTRYIFYRDYNVYYDCYRDVFITWTGRRWIVTHRVPNVILNVNFGNTVVTGVDYWDDDFDFYLMRRRPSFISIQANF